MGTKLPPKELDLYAALDKLLLLEWDPIGVSAFEEANAEYYAYLPQVFKLVMASATQEEIANYLNNVQTVSMALPENLRHCMGVTKKALQLKQQVGL